MTADSLHVHRNCHFFGMHASVFALPVNVVGLHFTAALDDSAHAFARMLQVILMKGFP